MTWATLPIKFRAADLLLFAGRERPSRIIEFGTCPPWHWPLFGAHWRWCSHFAFIADWHSVPELVESTTLTDLPCVIQDKRVRGVQVHHPLDRIESYNGTVWISRPRKGWSLSHDERSNLTRFVNGQLGQGYDMEGALRSATWLPSEYHEQVRFCSELGAAALQRVGLLPLRNPKGYTPSRLIRDLVRQGNYQTPERVK